MGTQKNSLNETSFRFLLRFVRELGLPIGSVVKETEVDGVAVKDLSFSIFFIDNRASCLVNSLK